MKKTVKRIVFVVIVVALILEIGLLVKTGKFVKLEGYMYSFAADITGISTDSDATSCDATSSDATSCDATSSDATSCNATSSNATSSNAIKVTNNEEETSTTSADNANPTTKKKITQVEATPVEEETEKDFEYKNSEITKEVIEKIKESDESRNIVVTVDINKNISKELFDAIKGTSRQLTIKSGDNQIVFNGKDITDSKDIDATISYNLVKNDAVLNTIGQDGVVINFANNGELPGTATVRIKVTDDMKTAISLNTIYVYYYNEANKELMKMANKATYKDGYIEFAINHNSKYVFVNAEIPENDGTTPVEDDNVTFLESHKMYVIIIIIAVFTVIFVVAILIIDKKTKGKAYKQK